MTTLRDEVVRELDSALDEWAKQNRETTAEVTRLRDYYGDAGGKNKQVVINEAKEQRQRIESQLRKHRTISSRATNAARDLRTQVESSENGVERMKKYGFPAAIGFTILGGVIGLAFGMKFPGLGQAIAIFVAIVVGVLAFGFVAFVLYFVMRKRAQRKERMWKEAQNDNQEGLRMAEAIEPKRKCLAGINDLSDDLAPANFTSTTAALVGKCNDYLMK